MFSGFKSLKEFEKAFKWKRCDIPINDIETMKMFQSTEQLSCIETTPMLIKFTLTLKVIKEFPAID